MAPSFRAALLAALTYACLIGASGIATATEATKAVEGASKIEAKPLAAQKAGNAVLLACKGKSAAFSFGDREIEQDTEHLLFISRDGRVLPCHEFLHLEKIGDKAGTDSSAKWKAILTPGAVSTASFSTYRYANATDREKFREHLKAAGVHADVIERHSDAWYSRLTKGAVKRIYASVAIAGAGMAIWELSTSSECQTLIVDRRKQANCEDSKSNWLYWTIGGALFVFALAFVAYMQRKKLVAGDTAPAAIADASNPPKT